MKSAANAVADFKNLALAGLGAVGVTLSARAFEGWIKGAMDASDAVHDMARQVGVSAEELSKLHHAAQVAGVDSGSLDNSLGKLNQNLGKIAQSGTGAAADALARFGLSAAKLADMGPEKSFEVSIDLLAKIPNAAERAAVAVELFGKSGQSMIRLAGEGAGSVARLKEEAKALGLAISDVDSEKIGEANDALDRVWGVVQGLANSIAVELSPYLTYVANLFVDWAKEGARAGSLTSQGFDFVAESIGYAADAVQVLTGAFHVVRGVFDQLFGLMIEGVDYLIKAFNSLAETIGLSTIELGTFMEDWSKLLSESGSKEVGKGFDALTKGEWAHAGVKRFIDDIKVAAGGRATLAAGKEAEFRKGGAFEMPVKPQMKLAAGVEMGSQAAYSAIATARGQKMDSVNNRIDLNTKTTADATTRSAATLGQLLDVARAASPFQMSIPGTSAFAPDSTI